MEREDDAFDEAASALEAIADGPAKQAAEAIASAFDEAGEAIERSLVKAAKTGELSFEDLAKKLTLLFAESVIENVFAKPLESAISAGVNALFGGARADGGPVTAGSAYLVGERGPELFRPATSGAVGGIGGVTVNVRVDGASGEAPGLARSANQIAARAAEAVSRAARRL